MGFVPKLVRVRAQVAQEAAKSVMCRRVEVSWLAAGGFGTSESTRTCNQEVYVIELVALGGRVVFSFRIKVEHELIVPDQAAALPATTVYAA